MRGIDEQVAKAEKAVAGKAPVKRNRFIKLVGANKSINRALEAKARELAGLKGYITNLPNTTPMFVIDAYHRLFQIEKSVRMSKHDLAARPIYHPREPLNRPVARPRVSGWPRETGVSIRRRSGTPGPYARGGCSR